MSSHNTYVFSNNFRDEGDCVLNPDGFFDSSLSESYTLIADKSNSSYVISLGLEMNGEIAMDMICLGKDYTLCYMSEFMNVDLFKANNWLFYAEFTNIGGILGIGYNESSNAFW